MKYIVAGTLALVAIAVGVSILTAPPDPMPRSVRTNPEIEPVTGIAPMGGPLARPQMSVAMPANFSAQETEGAALFAANCAACHGADAGGVADAGPPLIHRIYEPSHHGDAAFQLAAKTGARAHHWRFGDMPPVPGVSEQDVTKIVAWVRRVQRENGIE